MDRPRVLGTGMDLLLLAIVIVSEIATEIGNVDVTMIIARRDSQSGSPLQQRSFQEGSPRAAPFRSRYTPDDSVALVVIALLFDQSLNTPHLAQRHSLVLKLLVALYIFDPTHDILLILLPTGAPQHRILPLLHAL